MFEKETHIKAEAIIPVKFSEVDPLQIVWHGHYIRYFEDAREMFGKLYDLDYMGVYARGFAIPIVHIECNYKAPLKYGDTARATCTFIDTPAAKLIFRYTIVNHETGILVAEGKSTQVFLDIDGKLQLYAPDFFVNWKKKMLS